uniref:N-acetyltransferase domain-containing protein n=2 Tax=Chlamydomonas euryale TaxID=1486919 RepID=A0A7R9V5J8_9CHLO|mmetsp:Transcript_21073/g.63077  ORF Transcript_21073/g.63077 Transcript_21073/m.63077 type:complete len:458 (+) Transcript_21073:402-1775(+)
MGGYRITDRAAMDIAIEAVGRVRVRCQQAFSKGPTIPMIRRHTKGDREIHFEPALSVVTGNYVMAKRRGIVEGMDYGLTGEVRFVMKDEIAKQLALDNIVLQSNLAFTSNGEVLNCNTYDVGLMTAVSLGADKIFFMHTDDVAQLGLPAWLPLSGAQEMLEQRVEGLLSSQEMDEFKASMETVAGEGQPAAPHSRLPSSQPDALGKSMSGLPVSPELLAKLPRHELVYNLDIWHASGFPVALSTAVIACCKGVKRAHLLDARLDGGLLLELYSRDGVGTMISADFYEGIRRANVNDLDGIKAILEPLERQGVTIKRSREQLEAVIDTFIVCEREQKVMGCAMLLDLGATDDGARVAELGAFCIDPAFRGSGRGDSMLDYVEQDARAAGVNRLVLLTTRTADWFEQRDFMHSGPAYASTLLPEARRVRIDPARNSQLYVKQLEACDASMPRAGKRIGY